MPWLFSYLDTAFVLGFMVLITDLLWCVVCGLRFGQEFPFYPDVYGLILAGARNLAAMAFVFLVIGNLFLTDTIRFSRLTWATLAAYTAFLFVWFYMAPNPSLTDWNFAFRHGFGFERILQAFLISHVFGRSFVVVAFYSLFRTSQGGDNDRERMQTP